MLKPLKIEGMSIFVLVWLGQIVSLLGSSLSNFALNVWVYQQTGSITQLSFLILFTTLPIVIISPLAGVLVDRWNRRWVMILSDSGAALSTLTMALLLVSGQIHIWHIYLIYIATAVSSSFSAFQWPAYKAATTLLVPKKHLGRASGMTQLAQALGQLLSPVLAGILLEVIQLSGIIVLDFSSFLFSLTTLLLVRFPHHKVTESQETNKTSLLTEALYSFHYLTARSGLLALLFFLASSNFLLGILQVLAYPLILSLASPAQLGIIMFIGGVGMVTGSLLMSTWGSGRQSYINILFCFMLLNGFSMMVAGLYPSVFLFAVAAFLFFLGLPFINSSAQVIFQKKVAPEIQGRVFSLNSAICGSCLPLAYLVAGPLADRIFEPLMIVNGPLAGTIGQLIGTGPSRGIGLMFIVLGILTMLMTIVAYQYAPLRLVEDELPDAYH
ncbi:major facilitator superfamily MFS_1 [Kalymmatonema gypsitolerans NIES-4073]|nr:major facilitator superfamily MFS_1 [Scytonema sp. NIES-4073]